MVSPSFLLLFFLRLLLFLLTKNKMMRNLNEITTLLERHEDTRKIALSASYVGIWDWDIVTGEIYWDAGMHDIYESDPKDFDSNYEAWKHRLHPEDAILTDKEIKKCLADKDYRYFYRFRVMHRNEWRWVCGVGSCIRVGDVPVRMAGINILEPKDSEFNSRCSKNGT